MNSILEYLYRTLLNLNAPFIKDTAESVKLWNEINEMLKPLKLPYDFATSLEDTIISLRTEDKITAFKAGFALAFNMSGEAHGLKID